MNIKAISRNVGYALLVSALFMFLSVIVSMLNGNDSALAALIISFVITFTVGIFPFIFVRKTSEITLKDGYLIIFLSWLLCFIFGMLPYALWGGPFSVVNAFFESVSGFTTTGATILENVEALPNSLLFWRSATHFIGGLGVVVFLLLIIPNSSPVKMRLTNMELSSLSKEGYRSRANKTVYIFAYVYLAIAVLAFVAYLIAGMSPLDAVCHAFSVSATGGFSTRNLSIGAFDSIAIELITLFFMVLSSLHFGLLYLSFATRSLKPLNNPVLKFYLYSLLIFSVLTSFALKLDGAAATWLDAVRQGTFQTVCAASTSGFAITDNSHWPMTANVLIMFMAIMCGCAGSTSGGLKADRVLVLFKSLGRQLAKILHPSSVNEVKLGSRILKDEELAPHMLYIAVYCLIMAFSILCCSFTGMDGVEAVSSSVVSIGNVGPSVGSLGYYGSYNAIPAFAKLILTFDMFLGRIEIFPVLAVVGMIFDRKGRR